ncbi:MAG: hypothetical protein WEC80_01310 [Patescibacteria group bacterium]
MKNNRINLLVNKKGTSKVQQYLRFFKLTLVIVSSVLLLFSSVLGFLIFSQLQTQNKLEKEKLSNLETLSTEQENEVKLIKIANKTSDIELFSKDDANFYPYYQILTQSFNQSSEAANIETLNIEKDRKFNFSISFSNLNSLLENFKFIESEGFLSNFSTIYLKSLETEDRQDGKFYRITFEGVFKEINENKN